MVDLAVSGDSNGRPGEVVPSPGEPRDTAAILDRSREDDQDRPSRRDGEILEDQRHFDRAAEQRARLLADATQWPHGGADKAAMSALREHAQALQQAMGSAEDAVAFGRVDSSDERLYIGRHLILGEGGDPMVISWKAPAAARYYASTLADPMGVTRKRTFVCEGNTIIDFSDVLFGVGPEQADEFLQRVLAQGRTGSMRDIVATIQAAQYEIVTAPNDRVLVIEGGPGTGKTAVALHRVSWLLAQPQNRLRPDDVLVVGPSATFARYIRNVLPDLGDVGVPVRSINQLAPEGLTIGRVEDERLAELKGDARMADLLARALESRIGRPEPIEQLPGDGGFVTIPGAEIAEVIDECRAMPGSYNDRRSRFRERLAEVVARRGSARAQGLANLTDRLWPPQSATNFLHGLLGSRRRLEAAAGDSLSMNETLLLVRQGAPRVREETWSDGDVHLLDEIHHLITGDTPQYKHVVVDEAQDLSPMQLRSVARRAASGAITLVGDIAQSTGLWARDSWSDVTRHLSPRLPVVVERLRYGYRVPRPAYEFAARLLPVAAPGVPSPEVVRDGVVPTIHTVTLYDRADRVTSVAMEHATAGRFVGIVCPDRCWREVEAALTAAGAPWGSELGAASINLVSPTQAKGLEFDAVVVVEPEAIVAEHPRGLRMLYVALTRTTNHLDVVAVGSELPLSVPQQPGPRDDDLTRRVDRERRNRQVAELVAGQIRAAAPREDWRAIVAAVLRDLET